MSSAVVYKNSLFRCVAVQPKMSKTEVQIGSFGEVLLPPIVIGNRMSASQVPVTRPSTSSSAKYNFEMMKNGRKRLDTFTNGGWPNLFVSPMELAEAGFFYLKELDRVQCAFCRGVVRGWSQGDVAILEHERHYPTCPFVIGYPTGNQPIERDPFRDPNRPRLSYDVCGNNDGRIEDEMFEHTLVNDNSRNGDCPPNMRTNSNYQDYDVEANNRLGIRSHGGAKHPEHISIDSRLLSFSGSNPSNSVWPEDSPVKPADLAEAGLYYLGKFKKPIRPIAVWLMSFSAIIGELDYVKCFYCDGGLCSWEEGDNPWSEHKRMYGDICEFIQLNEDNRSQRTEANVNVEEIIEGWFNSDLLLEFSSKYTYSRNVIKNVLRKRWEDTHTPFSGVEELHGAVSAASRDPLNLNLNVESSDEEMVCVGSQSPGSSQESNLSSSPSAYSSEDDRETRTLCKICLDREVGLVFLPCGHLFACTRCGPGLQSCPVCRTHISHTVRTFLA